MLNVGGGEFLIILLVALIVLGPQKLPEAARQAGRIMTELRRVTQGFQKELKEALDAPVEADARERGRAVGGPLRPARPSTASPSEAASPAGEAGMYDVTDAPEPEPSTAIAEGAGSEPTDAEPSATPTNEGEGETA
jgi:sec-independent protein translocase protein TatB